MLMSDEIWVGKMIRGPLGQEWSGELGRSLWKWELMREGQETVH